MAKKQAPKKKKNTKLKRLLITLLILLVLLLIVTVLTPEEEVKPQPAEIGTAPAAGVVIESLEIPSGADGQIISHTGYTLCYSEEHEQPYWVAYVLTNEKINGTFEREDSFKADPAVTTGSATLADYRNSGYDRGHMIPFADLCYSEQAMSDSFYLSNMSPQVGEFNRGIWADIEAVVRNFAATNSQVYVVTGPVLTDGPYKTIGNNRVSVPNYYYKVILDYTDPGIKAIGFILPNEGSNESLQSFACSVDAVEALTGLDFFPLLEDSVEESLESVYDVSLWNFSQFYRSSNSAVSYTGEEQTLNTGTAELTIMQEIQNVLYGIFGEIRKQLVKEIKNLF